MKPAASPPTPNAVPAPTSPDPTDPSYVTITGPDVRLCAGIIVGKALYAAYQPLPVGLRVPRNLVNEYATTCTSPEEYRDWCMAGGEDGGLGAIQPGVPLRWNGRSWRRARKLTPEALRAEAQASLAGERALNEQRDADRAEEDARFAEVIASARDRHNAEIELEKAQMRVNAERSDDEYEAAREHYRQESVDLGLDLEPEPIRRPRDLSTVYAKAAKPAAGPAPAQPQATKPAPQATTTKAAAAKPKPKPKPRPSKPQPKK